LSLLAVAIAKDIPFVQSDEDLAQEEIVGEANAVESQWGYPGMMGSGMGYPGMMGFPGMMGQGMGMGMQGPQQANACGCVNTCNPCRQQPCQPCQNPCPPCNTPTQQPYFYSS
jgi:hypothetical protein